MRRNQVLCSLAKRVKRVRCVIFFLQPSVYAAFVGKNISCVEKVKSANRKKSPIFWHVWTTKSRNSFFSFFFVSDQKNKLETPNGPENWLVNSAKSEFSNIVLNLTEKNDERDLMKTQQTVKTVWILFETFLVSATWIYRENNENKADKDKENSIFSVAVLCTEVFPVVRLRQHTKLAQRMFDKLNSVFISTLRKFVK